MFTHGVPIRAGLVLCFLSITAATSAEQTPRPPSSPDSIDRGRYLAKIAGCNDCHTPGYIQTAGQVPENVWLTGSSLGWNGPWGTTYPPNLRIYLNRISEDEWVKIAHTKQYRPPMPWFALHDMTEEDLRAIHRFVVHLGPAGDPAPSYIPPDQAPTGAYFGLHEPASAKPDGTHGKGK